jgi:hypothetical protein
MVIPTKMVGDDNQEVPYEYHQSAIKEPGNKPLVAALRECA